MRIALVQTGSSSGELAFNLSDTLNCVARAAELGADLVMFPELSLTGYEPRLAAALQMGSDSEPVRTLHGQAQSLGIRVCVGLPTPGHRLPRISMVVLGGDPITLLHKHHLHEDELPFFEPGSASRVQLICGVRVLT